MSKYKCDICEKRKIQEVIIKAKNTSFDMFRLCNRCKKKRGKENGT